MTCLLFHMGSRYNGTALLLVEKSTFCKAAMLHVHLPQKRTGSREGHERENDMVFRSRRAEMVHAGRRDAFQVIGGLPTSEVLDFYYWTVEHT
jgi:hypothetical protein